VVRGMDCDQYRVGPRRAEAKAINPRAPQVGVGVGALYSNTTFMREITPLLQSLPYFGRFTKISQDFLSANFLCLFLAFIILSDGVSTTIKPYGEDKSVLLVSKK
jgi:hypothetical protein